MPWNYEQVQSMYPSTGVGFLHKTGDRINIHSPPVAHAIRDLVAKGGDPDDPSLILQAREIAKNVPPSPQRYLSPTFGHVAQWLSEVAGPTDLDALLRHADTYLHPTWSNGGLYYKRCDVGWDENGNYTYVEPYTGNAGIGYARLNVKDGQKKMFDSPWAKEDVEKQPWIDGVGLEQGVDCLRGRWDEEEMVLEASFRTWNGETVKIQPILRNLPPGEYGIYVDRELKETKNMKSSIEDLVVDLEVGSKDVDLVVLYARE